jgi:hypothetical protein
MTSSPSLTSNNFIITHHLNTLHNNVGNYFEFICMKTSLTMFDNSDTFENFFFIQVLQIIFCQSSTNFFIHDHQQQLPKTFSFMIINNNFIHHPSKTFSFMIINNNFIHHPSTKNFFIHDHQQQLHDHQQTFSSSTKNFFIHPCQVHTFSPPDSTTWSTHSS